MRVYYAFALCCFVCLFVISYAIPLTATKSATPMIYNASRGAPPMTKQRTFVCLFVCLPRCRPRCQSHTMPERGCEFEISGESDVLPIEVRNEANQKKKPTVDEVLKAIPTSHGSFSPLRIEDRSSVSLVPDHIQTPLQLLFLFISFDMRCIIAQNTNKNAIIKRKQEKVKKQDLKHCRA